MITARGITATVEELLGSVEGGTKVNELGALAKRMVTNAEKFGPFLKLIRARPTASFYINASRVSIAAIKQIKLSVRIGGVECGTVSIKGKGYGERVFRRSNDRHFEQYWNPVATNELAWEHPAVKTYLDRVSAEMQKPAHVRLAARESGTEATLLTEMRKPGKQGKPTSLYYHRPVCYPVHQGLPFQFPLPVRARNTDPEIAAPGKAGHVDVLARQRTGGRCLRVFEVKRPGAPARDVSHALNQAVAYCAALQFMLRDSTPGSATFRELIGIHGSPVLEAVAVVERTKANRQLIAKSARTLNGDGTSKFKLFVLFYTQKEDRPTFADQIVAAHLADAAE